MKRFLLIAAAVLFWSIGAFSMNKHTSLTEQHFQEGHQTPNATHTIAWESGDHPTFYVTEAEKDEMNLYTFLGFGGGLLFMAVMFIYTRIYPQAKLHELGTFKGIQK